MLRSEILGLYKNLLRYSEKLKYTDKKYFVHRVRKGFLENRHLANESDVQFQYKGLCSLNIREWSDNMFLTNFQIFTLQNLLCNIFHRQIFTTWQNFKSLKKYIDYSKVPKLQQQDLEIQYVRGSGPGGQSTNKTSNAVVMKHVPTGIVVKCHETRSQFKNKEIAEQLLINKLDILFNGEHAVENQEKRLLKKKSLEKERRQKKLAALKAAFKEREGLD